MSKKKKISIAVIAVIIVIAVAAAVFAFLRHQQTTQYNAVMTEVSLINELTDEDYTGNIDRDKLNDLLERRVASGKYGNVENAFKNYMTDLYTVVFDATDAANDDSLATFLSADNLEDDGPEFKESKATVSELISRLETDKEKYLSITADDSVESYAKSEQLDGKYYEMYTTIMSAQKTSEEADSDKFTSSADSIITKLKAVDSAFDFLSANSDNWYIADGKLTFKTEALYNDYAELMENIK